MMEWLRRLGPAQRDALVILGLCLLVAVSIPSGTVRGLLAAAAREDHAWLLDKLLAALLVAPFGLAVFLWQWRKDLRRETRLRAAAEARYQTLFDAAPFEVILMDPKTHAILDVNARACREYGYSREEFLRLRIGDIDAMTDADSIRARGRAHMIEPGVQEFEAQHRQKSGELRDVLVRVKGVFLEGRDVTYGVHFNITDRKQMERQRQLLLGELDHRARNLLGVVQAALRLIPKEDAQSYARAVEARVAALSRAHTLLAGNRWMGADLRAVLAGELSGFLTDGAAPRAELDGPRVMLSASATQALSMAVHELATNATKHGALSRAEGRLRITWRIAPDRGLLHLRWVESGGPAIVAPPARSSFGSRVLASTIRRQLGGQISLSWETGGLVCEIAIPLARLSIPSAPAGIRAEARPA